MSKMTENKNAVMNEEQIGTKTEYKGRVISVSTDDVMLANGQKAKREVVHHTGGAGVIAIDEEENIYLIRQFRYALGRIMTEIPAGKLEVGENPKEAAERELAEETGLRAKKITPLASVIPTCGYCDEIIYIYLAEGLSMGETNLDDGEFVSTFKISLDKAVQMVLEGEIIDSKTVSAILQVHLLLQQGKILL